MKSLTSPKLLSHQSGGLVSLGERHGYRFDGDTVYLHAMFVVHSPEAHAQSWALQLWACPTAPMLGNELAGHLVAHAALPPIGEIADDTHAFGVSTHAQVPAGRAEHVMILALVANGEIHDYRMYLQSERFYAPALRGTAGFQIYDSRVNVSLEAVENPRSAGNLSSTLAIELWALPDRYDGGAFSGFPLAGAAFDALPGQWECTPRSFGLPFTAPPAGAWQIVAMLREWTAAGFQTRDYVNFDVPYIQSAPPAAPALPSPVAPQAPAAAPKKARVRKPTAKSAAAAPLAPAAAPEKARARKVTTKPVAVPSVEADLAKAPKTDDVSVNKASVDDLARLSGMTRKVAEAIVKARPLRSLDEVAKVKGVSAKLLGKIRPGLKL